LMVILEAMAPSFEKAMNEANGIEVARSNFGKPDSWSRTPNCKSWRLNYCEPRFFLCLVCCFDTLEWRLCCLLHSREDSTAVILKVNREGSYFYVTNVFLVVVCCFHMLWEFVFSITFVAIHLKNFFYKQWVFHAYPLYFLGKDYRICRLIR
jgi:hypothetical protein